MFVVHARRQQQLSGLYVAPLTAQQDVLHVVWIDAMEELQRLQQGAPIIGVDWLDVCHNAILTRMAVQK